MHSKKIYYIDDNPKMMRVKKSKQKDSAAFVNLPQPYFYTGLIGKHIYSQSDVYCIIIIKITPLQLKKNLRSLFSW